MLYINAARSNLFIENIAKELGCDFQNPSILSNIQFETINTWLDNFYYNEPNRYLIIRLASYKYLLIDTKA